MDCAHFDAGRCRSCAWLERSYGDQLAAKDRLCRELLGAWADIDWLPPVESREEGFRNKAKMVVAGTLPEPTLGILDEQQRGVDLRDCGLHQPGLRAALPALAAFVARAAVAPYDVSSRRGELKHLLVTESPDGELMARFVLRSTEALPRIRKHLGWLLEQLPRLAVVSANLQPEHKAVLEGPQEIALTERQTLRMRVNGIDLHLRPQSFFQTNTEVAAALYRQGRHWVEEVGPRTVWDLYCGAGGFALHLAAPGRRVTGIELSADAVASAELSRDELGLPGLDFHVGDATAYALGAGGAAGLLTDPVPERVPDLVVVNPPRRGIGPRLAAWLEESRVQHVVYSSCNAASLARDLAAMPSLRPRRARVLDMFPQTAHYEVLTLLERVA